MCTCAYVNLYFVTIGRTLLENKLLLLLLQLLLLHVKVFHLEKDSSTRGNFRDLRYHWIGYNLLPTRHHKHLSFCRLEIEKNNLGTKLIEGVTTRFITTTLWGMWITEFLWSFQGLYLLSGRASYRKISWSLEAARLNVILIVSLWNLTGSSAAALPSCLSNFRAIEKALTWISRLQHFAKSCGKTSARLVNRGPGSLCIYIYIYEYQVNMMTQ